MFKFSDWKFVLKLFVPQIFTQCISMGIFTHQNFANLSAFCSTGHNYIGCITDIIKVTKLPSVLAKL